MPRRLASIRSARNWPRTVDWTPESMCRWLTTCAGEASLPSGTKGAFSRTITRTVPWVKAWACSSSAMRGRSAVRPRPANETTRSEISTTADGSRILMVGSPRRGTRDRLVDPQHVRGGAHDAQGVVGRFNDDLRKAGQFPDDSMAGGRDLSEERLFDRLDGGRRRSGRNAQGHDDEDGPLAPRLVEQLRSDRSLRRRPAAGHGEHERSRAEEPAPASPRRAFRGAAQRQLRRPCASTGGTAARAGWEARARSGAASAAARLRSTRSGVSQSRAYLT